MSSEEAMGGGRQGTLWYVNIEYNNDNATTKKNTLYISTVVGVHCEFGHSGYSLYYS